MHIDRSICEHLSSLESEFFQALQDGSEALIAFESRWQAFSNNLEKCRDQLQAETLSKIYCVASIANIVTSNLIEVGTRADVIQSEFREDVIRLLRNDFSKLTIHDKPQQADVNAIGSYIPFASKWLIENLHNPYPTKQARLEISILANNAPLKDIDAWFTDARKRIGWNKLRQEHFPKRNDLIQAATRFFKETPSIKSTSQSVKDTVDDTRYLKFANQFVQMEERCRELYLDKVLPSNLASTLSHTEPIQPSESPASKANWDRITQGYESSYPTPRSPALSSQAPSSPSPSLCNLSDNKKLKRKRSLSPTEMTPDVGHTNYQMHSPKRSRFGEPARQVTTLVPSLPSPPASVVDSSFDRQYQYALSPGLPSDIHVGVQPLAKRKRDLSDDDRRVAKRTALVPSIPCVQRVPSLSALSSSTSESETSWDDIFAELGVDYTINCEIPPPVHDEVLDQLSEVNVSYHSYDSVASPYWNDKRICSGVSESNLCSELLEDVITSSSPNYFIQSATLCTSDLPHLNISVPPVSSSPTLDQFDYSFLVQEGWENSMVTTDGEMLLSNYVHVHDSPIISNSNPIASNFLPFVDHSNSSTGSSIAPLSSTPHHYLQEQGTETGFTLPQYRQNQLQEEFAQTVLLLPEFVS